MNDQDYMKLALMEAEKAARENEIPIGAVLVWDDMVIAANHNRKEQYNDPTAHAELLVLREGAEFLGLWRLTKAVLYVTIEPCPMCAGGLLNARIKRLVYGSGNKQYGAIQSRFHIHEADVLNHHIEIATGILADECQNIINHFFHEKRAYGMNQEQYRSGHNEADSKSVSP